MPPPAQFHPDAHEDDADHGDDRAGDDRGEEPKDVADEAGVTQSPEQAADNHRAIDAVEPDDQAPPPWASIGEIETAVTPIMTGRRMPNGPKADRLDQRGDAAGEEVGVDQDRDLVLRHFQRGAEDQRHGDRVGVHDQHVLQSENEQARRGQDFIDGMGLHGRDGQWTLMTRDAPHLCARGSFLYTNLRKLCADLLSNTAQRFISHA